MKIQIGVRTLKAGAMILATVLVLTIGFVLLHTWETGLEQEASGDLSPTKTLYEDERELSYVNGGWYAKRQDLDTILVLGLDKFENTTLSGYNNNQQSDFMLLLAIDRASQKITALHLNRDTMTEIQILGVTGEPAGTFTGQLALAHTYGSGETDSCENAALAVSKLLYGVEIDHYISMTMDGVALLNDFVGGVTVEVLDDFSQVDSSLVQGEAVTLRGEQALRYVRSRSGLEDSSNLRRMERQRQYLSALQHKLADCAEQDAGFVLQALMTVNDYLVSDCTVEKLSNLAETVRNYGVENYRTLDGEAVQGEEYMEFYVDEQALQSLVLEVFYEPAEKP